MGWRPRKRSGDREKRPPRNEIISHFRVPLTRAPGQRRNCLLLPAKVSAAWPPPPAPKRAESISQSQLSPSEMRLIPALVPQRRIVSLLYATKFKHMYRKQKLRSVRRSSAQGLPSVRRSRQPSESPNCERCLEIRLPISSASEIKRGHSLTAKLSREGLDKSITAGQNIQAQFKLNCDDFSLVVNGDAPQRKTGRARARFPRNSSSRFCPRRPNRHPNTTSPSR